MQNLSLSLSLILSYLEKKHGSFVSVLQKNAGFCEPQEALYSKAPPPQFPWKNPLRGMRCQKRKCPRQFRCDNRGG